MKRYYKNQKVLLRKNLKLGQIIKYLPDSKYLVSYYENNILEYDVITDVDVVDKEEYEVIRNRINLINKLLDS